MNIQKILNLSKQYCSFDYGNVHFLAMSSEVQFDKKSKQYYFVTTDLKHAADNKSDNWIGRARLPYP